MRRLVLKLLLVLTPVMAVYGFPLFVMLRVGELTSIESVVRSQMSRDHLVLYGPVYSNQARELKLQGVLARGPRVIALGTSRVMQFRSAMFKDPAQFYNAGGAVEKIGELRPFLERIPRTRQPDTIIVGLDQWLFNPNSGNLRGFRAANTTTTAILQTAKLRVYQDYREGKFTVAALLGVNGDAIRIGLNAIVNNNGFRNDGSYYYGRFIADPMNPTYEDFQFRDTFRRIALGTERFEFGPHVSPDAVAELSSFLASCHQRGIHVVGFLPPFAHAVYEKLEALRDRYGYLSEIVPQVNPVFAEYSDSFFDFSDLGLVAAPDTETIDGLHGSERAYLRILLATARSDQRLREYIDPQYLEARLAAASGPYTVFENHEF